MSGFLEVTLCMYNSFVYLRKECLDGVANKTAVCSVSEKKNMECIKYLRYIYNRYNRYNR